MLFQEGWITFPKNEYKIFVTCKDKGTFIVALQSMLNYSFYRSNLIEAVLKDGNSYEGIFSHVCEAEVRIKRPRSVLLLYGRENNVTPRSVCC
jgi:hypothetical protein